MPNKTAIPLLAWFAAHPIAANLLMALIWLAGLSTLVDIPKDVFPKFTPDRFEIAAFYPDASPLTVETALCIPLENAVYDLPGVKGLNTAIFPGECQIQIEVNSGYQREALMSAVRARIDAIPGLPEALEKIDVRETVRDNDDGVIWVALYGQLDALQLKRLGDALRQELTQLPGVTAVVDYGKLNEELSVNVSAARLRQYGLTLADLASAIRCHSIESATGMVNTPSGDIVLQLKSQAKHSVAVGEITLRSLPDGGVVKIKDIASIHDGLSERAVQWRHDGQPAQGYEIHAEANAITVAERIKTFVAQKKSSLPAGVSLKTWWDDSLAFAGRVNTLLEDGLSGFVLVWLVLTLFLRGQVAWWAGMGIITSVLGTLWCMPLLGISLNMLSLFGFLLAMGILVDDAIIIGESIHSEQQNTSLAPHEAAAIGVSKMALPVLLAILIAIAAFVPGLFLPGWSGAMMRPIAGVMILTLLFSALEALLILPAHLHKPAVTREPDWLKHSRRSVNFALRRLVIRVYQPLLARLLVLRYLTLAGFIAFMLLTLGWYLGGHVKQAMNPDITKDAFWARLTVPPGTAPDKTRQLAERVERELLNYRDELERQDFQQPLFIGQETLIWQQEAGLWLELSEQARQRINVQDFVDEWRRRVGDLGNARLEFIVKEGDEPYDILLNLSANQPALLTTGAAALKQQLAAYPGVYSVLDSTLPGSPELQLSLTDTGRRLGLTEAELAEQVRHGYYGLETQRLQRLGGEVRVVVRLPAAERQTLADLQRLPIRLPNGELTVLDTVADTTLQPGLAQLIRRDRQRVLEVSAQVDPAQANLNAIYTDIEQRLLPELERQFPGLTGEIGRDRKEQQTMLHSLAQQTLMALAVIYALIAVTFRSYTLPLLFLLAVPMAWCGAVWAHSLACLPLSMESLIGMVAASGVVVNDSMVLLDYLNEHDQDAKQDPAALIAAACTARFRPIFLAFLTNFAGFLPTLLETSIQAQFLIPMTLSLASGLLFGMIASLMLVPVCYAVLGDGRR